MIPVLAYEFIGTILMTASFYLFDDIVMFFSRSLSYFMIYILAYYISGAHLNPATSIAVYLYEKKYKEYMIYLPLEILC